MKAINTGRRYGLLTSVKWGGALALLALLPACNRGAPSSAVVALEPGSDTACVLDGMLLKDFPGPKGQIHYAEGPPDFYCDLKELFTVLLAPEQKRAPAAVLVQDMGKTDWDHPNANWIDAKTAVYVGGSRKQGSMGPTFGSFSSLQDAEKFAQQEGGKTLRFDQVTPEMVNLTGGVVNDRSMSR
ncbi:MAG: nitrous oxide reductase accessory protein NosL [Polaromonas sp.]